jgi:hypothetical protein
MHNSEEIDLQVLTNEKVEVKFKHLTLSQPFFNALIYSLKFNHESKKIVIEDISIDQDMMTIRVGGIEGHTSEFIQLLETEMLMSTIMPYPQRSRDMVSILSGLNLPDKGLTKTIDAAERM